MKKVKNIKEVIISIAIFAVLVGSFVLGGVVATIQHKTQRDEIEKESTTVDGENGSAGVSVDISNALKSAKNRPESTGGTAGISLAVSNALKDAKTAEVMYNSVDLVRASAIIDEPVMHQEANPLTGSVYVNCEGLNIRSEPSADASILVAVSIGTKLDQIEEVTKFVDDNIVSKWTHVEYNNIDGYVDSGYLSTDSPLISLGDYVITYYCPCSKCCGWNNMPTASGVMPQEGVTVAADPSIPFGTELVIDGRSYIVQDRGGAIKGKHIDIFVTNHDDALKKAVQNHEVYMKVK